MNAANGNANANMSTGNAPSNVNMSSGSAAMNVNSNNYSNSMQKMFGNTNMSGGRRRHRNNRTTLSDKHYETTANGAMMWAKSELEHVGRIAGVKDKDLQYSYAMSTLYGMAHLKDALYELVTDPAYKHHKQDLLRTHDTVIRVMKHLCKEYKLNLNAIRAFNERKVLSNLSYLTKGTKTRSNRKSKRSTRKH